MIEHIKEPWKPEAITNVLHPYVKEWFFSKFKEYSLPQLYGVMEVHNKNNILISAPTGGTKCVTPDTPLLVGYNGRTHILEARQLVDLAHSKGNLIKHVDASGRLFDVPGLFCFSVRNNKFEKKKALVYYEKTEAVLCSIKTECGREVRLSQDHPLLVEREGDPEWIPVRDLNVGDRIAVPRKLQLPEREISLSYKGAIRNARKRARCVVDYADFLVLRNKTNNFTSFDQITNKEFYQLMTLLQLSLSGLARATGISAPSLSRYLHRNTRIVGLSNVLAYFTRCLKNKSFEQNRVIIADSGGKVHSFLYPYKVDKRLIRWLAFVLAEGFIGDYKKGTHLLISQRNRKNLLQEILTNTQSLFDQEFVRRANSDKDYVINSTTFCYFICDLLDLKRGRGRYVPIPSWVLDLTKDLKSSFLNVFFSLEATATSRRIIISQANKNKIETLNYLLLSFGIFSSLEKSLQCATNTPLRIKRQYYKLTISDISNLQKYLSYIDIDHPNRDLLQRHITKKSAGAHKNKFLFDFRNIRRLSEFYRNDEDFNKELGNIYEVVRRTGFITLAALSKLKSILMHIDDPTLKELDAAVDGLLTDDITWVSITKKQLFRYKGIVVDLTVPDVHNFVGGFGGICLHNTMTSFLAIINELVILADNNLLEDRVYTVYCSPLKALNNDIFVNLTKPLEEIKALAQQKNKDVNIRVAVRTGDTTPYERQKMLKKPPHILVTTPESLSIVLTSPRFKELLNDVQYCIIDEVHALAENKRGVHLSLSLERLQDISPKIVRIGLSATCEPLESIAQYLVGTKRNCKIANVQFLKKFDLQVMSPVPDLVNTTFDQLHNSLYDLLDTLIQEHKTTLVFTNTRAGTERIVHHLKMRFPKKYTENIGAHHGSLSKAHRLGIEERLKKGELKAIISSTSLELGIDIGYIDLVVCIGSPKSIARLLQRTGRAGHALHETVKGRIIVMDRDDLVECAVMLKLADERKIDKIHIPENCLDVLAQQMYGMAIQRRWNIKELYACVTSSYCYRNLTWKDFMDVMSYLSGEFVSLEDRNVYAKVWYDKETGEVGKRGKMSRVIYMTNIGTIPDETSVIVKVKDRAIGSIDEAFLERLKRNDIFVLGGDTYQFLFSRGMVAQVMPAHERKPTVPSWFSEMLPLSFDVANEIQRFRRYALELIVNKKPKDDIIKFIHEYTHADENAAQAIYNYILEQYKYVGVPHDRKILIENFEDEKGKKYAIFHTLYGRRVNDVLSRAVAYVISKMQHRDVEIGISDNGFYVASLKNIQALRAFEFLKPHELRELMRLAIEKTEILKRRFRHCAGRALMILREYKGKRKHVGRQQVSSMILLKAVKEINQDFSILKEARREVLEDLMDIANAEKVLEDVAARKIELKQVTVTIPSPFAFLLATQGYTDILKMEDKIEFIRRMHQNVLAKIGKTNLT